MYFYKLNEIDYRTQKKQKFWKVSATVRGGLPLSLLDNIVNDYGKLVSAICHQMIRNEEHSKEATQEVWLGIVKSLPTFEGKSKMST